MESNSNAMTDLETRLTQLSIVVGRTKAILDSGKQVAIKRHLEALQTTTKVAVETTKISEKVELAEINKWSEEIDGKFEVADEAMMGLEKWLTDTEKVEQFVTQEEQIKYELRLHEKKLQMQAELAKTSKPKPEIEECELFTTTSAKLPKLVITKFDGSCMNWPKFWSQFSEAIDKSTIAPITKFTYLLELLEPKVKRCVEALPFSPEGYNRAKAILHDKYGKETEIVKCYVKEILDLAHILGTSPHKIADFHEKLTHCVQALETMGKLSEINGNVSMTLEKLAGIRGDLVRTDSDWESWDFVKLVEAVRQWVKRNPVTAHNDENNRRKLFNARGEEVQVKGCVYCGDAAHKATQCTKVNETSKDYVLIVQCDLTAL